MAKRFLKPLSARATGLMGALFVMGLHATDVLLAQPGTRMHPAWVTFSILVEPLIVFLVVTRLLAPVLLRVRETRRASSRDILRIVGSGAIVFICLVLPNALYA